MCCLASLGILPIKAIKKPRKCRIAPRILLRLSAQDAAMTSVAFHFQQGIEPNCCDAQLQWEPALHGLALEWKIVDVHDRIPDEG